MAKRYDQYCPVAHALDLVGERWALLVVRELMDGPLRYTDLLERLDGCGTNILAARLRRLEAGGVVQKRRLAPPYASTVYELTEYGTGLRLVLHELALWGVRSLGPPPDEAELQEGWLKGALCVGLGPAAPEGRFEFRVGDEVASLVDGDAVSGPIDEPDVVVVTTPPGFYALLAERDLAAAQVEGNRALLAQLVEAMAIAPVAPVEPLVGTAALAQTVLTTSASGKGIA